MLNGTAAPLRGFAAVDSYSPHSLALPLVPVEKTMNTWNSAEKTHVLQ